MTISAESLSFMPDQDFPRIRYSCRTEPGRGRADRARTVTYRSIRYAVIVMGGVALIFFAVPQIIVSFFTDDAEVVLLASTCLRIASLEQIFIGIGDTFRGSLRGAGDTISALRITAIGTWLVRVPVLAFIIYVLRLSLPAVWVGICFEWVIRAVVGRKYFARGNWESIKLH